MRILEYIEVWGGRERDWHLSGWYIAKTTYWLPYRASADGGETYQWYRPAVFEERARRKAKSDNDVADPKERLWRDVSVHFLPDPDGSWHAGPDVGVEPLSPAMIGRAWDRILSLAGSEDLDHTWWHEGLGGEVRTRDVERLTRARFGIGQLGDFYVRFYRMRFNSVLLPPVGVWVQEDHIAFHWWLGPDEHWGPDEAAALIELLDELRAGAPDARLTIEWDITTEGFVTAAETYLASIPAPIA